MKIYKQESKRYVDKMARSMYPPTVSLERMRRGMRMLGELDGLRETMRSMGNDEAEWDRVLRKLWEIEEKVKGL